MQTTGDVTDRGQVGKTKKFLKQLIILINCAADSERANFRAEMPRETCTNTTVRILPFKLTDTIILEYGLNTSFSYNYRNYPYRRPSRPQVRA